MIDAGVPETAAEDNARALNLFAQGDADYVTDDVPAILGRPALTFAVPSFEYPTILFVNVGAAGPYRRDRT